MIDWVLVRENGWIVGRILVTLFAFIILFPYRDLLVGVEAWVESTPESYGGEFDPPLFISEGFDWLLDAAPPY